ncbi:MAG TPA: translation initiation factor IF-2 [Coriobacteriia bacterium]|nr:translation initiation factor IF-2 [Coriobacteriia bacterium]
MPSMRVHELAKEFGMSSKELLDKLQAMKIPAKNHASTLVEAYVDKIRKELGPEIAERQQAIEEERKKTEAIEAEKKAAEEAKRKADEEARRKAEDAERKAREAERNAREEEQKRLLEEARKRAEEEENARMEAETADARAQIEAAAPVVEVVVPEPEVEVVVEEPAEVAAPDTRSPLEIAIAAEKARLDAEKAATQEKKEEERYRQMAREAEQLQRDKVIEEAKAAVAAAQAEGGKKKKKKHKKTGEEAEDARHHESATHAADVELVEGAVTVTEGVTVGDFAELLGVPANDIIKRLFMLGTPLTVNQPMGRDLLEIVGEDMGVLVQIIKPEEEQAFTYEDKEEDLVDRPPVVTVMGHVDHGKTSLLDAIRETGVAATEAGGITQHIGASVVHKNGRQITFIDTPGHEAFTAMRQRGANITDIVILVVAADDGVMPQTIEAIHHAQAAGVPIIVAVNKIDKDGANPEQVRQMLTEHQIVPEEWGGTNIFVNVSAKKRIGIDDLLEMVLLQADVLELKANPNAEAFGVVIEAKLDKGRGPVATMLVQRGTLRVGDGLVAGTAYGRVRALVDPMGKQVTSAGPADPVEILGLGSVPSAGDDFRVYADERDARSHAEERAMKERLRDQAKTKKHVSLEDLFARIEEGELKDLNLIVKADVQGSIEAVTDALDKMDQTEVRINVIHSAVGGITESDVMLADTSDAIIIGFNVRPAPKAKALAEKEHVDIRMYRVIYQAIEEINAARVGMLAPDVIEQDTSHIEVRELFRVPKMGVIAGCYVVDGEINRDDQVRIVRDGTVILEGKIGSLRRFKEDVKTVKSGYECGIGIDGFQDLKEGDIIEGFKVIEVARES